MTYDLPSRTAIAVAFARAVVTRDIGAPGEGLDPFARGLLPGPVGALADAVPPAAARALSLGVVDHCELRSLAIDAVARDALSGGARQLVILGAGLDARAWRLQEASAARCFEVDHPATQRYKRARVPSGSRVVFVPVDFSRDSLEARLAEAGHDTSAPTLWIWEGVTPYLLPAATAETLRIVRARSARGSTLAVTYVTPEMTSALRWAHPLIGPAFALLGEPLLGAVEPATLAAALEEQGYRVVDEGGSDAWGMRFGDVPRVRIAERLAVGRVE